MDKFVLDKPKIELVIDGHDREIETEIPQGSPVSFIFFLIYISGVFSKVSETSSLITSLSFIDDLGFIASGSSVTELVKILEKAAQTVLEWGTLNAVTCDT